MKTTIDLPEELLIRAKVAAAENRTSLRELVIAGLNRILTTESETESQMRRKRLLAALQASNTEPMVPLTREEIHHR